MKRSRLPLMSLLAFEATARLGRQSAAADELGVTTGAISRHIRNLEMQLDVPLMAGSRREPTLSEAAQKLADVLTPAFDTIDRALKCIRKDELEILDVACLSSFAMRWLIPRLSQFHAKHTKIDVRLSTKEPVANSRSRRSDIAILVIDPGAKEQVDDKLLFNEIMTVVVSPTLQQIPADMSAMVRLSTLTRINAWELWDAAQENRTATATAVTRQFEHYTFAIEAAANGLGACAVPYHLVMDDLASGRLIAPFGTIITGYRYFARSRKNLNVASDTFCNWLRTECQNIIITTDQMIAS